MSAEFAFELNMQPGRNDRSRGTEEVAEEEGLVVDTRHVTTRHHVAQHSIQMIVASHAMNEDTIHMIVPKLEAVDTVVHADGNYDVTLGTIQFAHLQCIAHTLPFLQELTMTCW